MKTIRFLCLILTIFTLAGCATGAVQFAPTPLPPDLSPMDYAHPGGAFSISVPRNWSTYVQNTGALASVSFSPPDSPAPLLTVAVINTGAELGIDGLTEAMDEIQTLHRPDLVRYAEANRSALGDGSWLAAGTRTLPGGDVQQINSFYQAQGTMLAMIDVIIPTGAVRLAELQTAINTLRINAEAPLVASELATFGFVRTVPLEVLNVGTWSNDQGVFFVTGEVRNNSENTLTQIPVRVSLTDDAGNALIDAADLVMGHAVPPGGFAPFSLRFGAGQPAGSTRYRVELGTPQLLEGRRLLGAGALAWEEESTFTPEGHLLITGTVTNNDAAPVDQLLAMVTVFDAAQSVIGAWFVELPNDPLLAGASAPYEVRVLELGGEPVNYIIEIQGLGE